MIKKILLTIAIVLGLSTAAMARDTYAHDASVLPQAAQTTLKNNMKAKVSVVKIEKTLGRVEEYEVIMNDGTEVTFDRDGNWQNVEVNRNSSVPSGFVPKAIAEFVKKNHSGQKIIGIEKDRKGYEVEITNGIDMKFDRDGNFLRYDD